MDHTPGLHTIPLDATAIDRHVYRSELAAVGAYRCPPDHPWFAQPGPILNHCVVFPRSASVIAPDGYPPFVGDQNTISLYNARQRYGRKRLSDLGDACDYFAVSESVIRDMVRDCDPSAAEREALFTQSHATCDPTLYLVQRRLFQVAASRAPDVLIELDEQILWLIEAIVRRVWLRRDVRPRNAHATCRRHREITEDVKGVLARNPDAPPRLGPLARAVGISPYHLCRVFRAATGTTLGQYRHRLRLAEGLERLETNDDLTTIALDLGYSSHSHFAAVFRRTYGVQPSVGRRWLAPNCTTLRAGVLTVGTRGK